MSGADRVENPLTGWMLFGPRGQPIWRCGGWKVFCTRKEAVIFYGKEAMLQDGATVKRVNIEAQP